MIVVALALVAIALVVAAAALVLTRSDDSSGSANTTAAFDDACSVATSKEIGDAVGYRVGAGVPVSNVAPYSGCAYAPITPTDPSVGVIVTDDVPAADLFNRDTLAQSYTSVESVRGIGQNAFFATREPAPNTTEGLLVVTDGNVGVQVAINGLVSPSSAFDLAKPVAELYAARLGLEA